MSFDNTDLPPWGACDWPPKAASSQRSSLTGNAATVDTTVQRRGSRVSIKRVSNANALKDDAKLEALGKEQELYRGYSPLAAFSFCFTCVSIVPSLAQGLVTAIANGGPALTIWMWFAGGVCSMLSGLALAEMASVWPVSGSVYYWSGMLAPPRWAPVCAYFTGYCNWFGCVSGGAAFAVGFSTSFAYIIKAATEDFDVATANFNLAPGANLTETASFEMSSGASVLISVGVQTVWTGLNFLRSDALAPLNTCGAFIQIVGTFVFMIVLLACTNKFSTKEIVFGKTFDCSDFDMMHSWGKEGCAHAESSVLAPLTAIIGLQSVVYAFVGYDGGCQIAEETQDAESAAPSGVIGTVVVCFVTGTMFLLTFLFATPDITQFAALDQDPFFYTVFLNVGNAGTVVMMIILNLMFLFAGLGNCTASARSTWAMSRDGAFPFHSSFEKISPTTFVPQNALIMLFFVQGLLLCLPLVNEVAMSSITATCALSCMLSYTVPIILRLTSARKTFKAKKFSLGCLSIPIGIVVAVYQSAACVILLFPTQYPVTISNMNWTFVVMGTVLLVALVYWFAVARGTYQGPKKREESNDDARTLELGPLSGT